MLVEVIDSGHAQATILGAGVHVRLQKEEPASVAPENGMGRCILCGQWLDTMALPHWRGSSISRRAWVRVYMHV